VTEATELLMVLWPWGYGEIRAYSHGARSVWAVAGDRASVDEALQLAGKANAKGRHIAHGVNPRGRMRHPCGREKDVSFATTIVFDFDSGDEVDAGLLTLAKLGLEPSVLIHTGRGMHAYLLLDKPTRVERVKPVAQALNHAVGGDSVFDPPRIMRTPGTINWRTGTKASIIRAHYDRRYKVDDLVNRVAPDPPVTERAGPPPACAFTSKDPVLDGLLRGETSRYRSRSEGTMGATRRLITAGYSRTEARVILMASPLADRSEADVDRCLDKVTGGQDTLYTIRVTVTGQRITTNGHFLRLKGLDDPFRERTWWQPIRGVLQHVERCLSKATPGVNAQRRGVVRVGWDKYQGRRVPRVFFFVPRS